MRLKLTIILFFISLVSFASQRAITDTGEEVILNDDGTWQLASNKKPLTTIEINKKIFTKPKDASFLIKSTKNNTAFWLDTSKWRFKKATSNADAEYELQLKEGDLYGMLISERIEIKLESLVNIAIDNAKGVAPDLEVVKKEYRKVNNNKVIYMEMNGTTQGIKVTYLGYYYSDKSGSSQFLIYTATNLVKKYKSEIINLLNGFTAIP